MGALDEPGADRSESDPSAGQPRISARGHDVLQAVPRAFDRERLAVSAPVAAVTLLGGLLLREEDEGPRILARIVETEAYRQDDPASHSHGRRTVRVEPMFGRPGTSYVYRSYGLHWCLNITVEPPGIGAAVLIRAAIVLEGAAVVGSRHPRSGPGRRDLLRGPGRLTRGLDVDGPRHHGGDMVEGVGGLVLVDDGWHPDPAAIRRGPRVGVSRAAELPWRFHLEDVPEVSAYRRSPRAGPEAPS